MSSFARVVSLRLCRVIPPSMIRAAIKAGDLPPPRVCDCGRMVFTDADVTAAVKHFTRKPPA
jgi:hypothetical protein